MVEKWIRKWQWRWHCLRRWQLQTLTLRQLKRKRKRQANKARQRRVKKVRQRRKKPAQSRDAARRERKWTMVMRNTRRAQLRRNQKQNDDRSRTKMINFSQTEYLIKCA